MSHLGLILWFEENSQVEEFKEEKFPGWFWRQFWEGCEWRSGRGLGGTVLSVPGEVDKTTQLFEQQQEL